MMRISTIIILGSLLLNACSNKRLAGSEKATTEAVGSEKLVDRNATAETKALFKNLMKLSKDHTLFGHQHATEYGHGWAGVEDRSDVKSVTGSHPAVIGVDISGFTGTAPGAIQKSKEDLRKTVVDTYDRGGVVTVAWHFSNPLSGGGFYWKDSVSIASVKHLIPGGSAHQQYKEILKGIGEWANNTRGKDGKLAPMIFRPFHEFDGDWFWWGKKHTSREDFISIWRFTVSYLRDSVGVHNFIYAFSPDNRFNTEEEFLERYPGDEWVDMVGMDNYGTWVVMDFIILKPQLLNLRLFLTMLKKQVSLLRLLKPG
jgi:mannan endo-1,4-beta-mannosidase